MEIFAVFGVGLGNLGQFARKREEKVSWVRCLNLDLAKNFPPTKILTTFGHTVNFIVQSAASEITVCQRLTEVLKTNCAVIESALLEKIVSAVSELPKTASSNSFRYTSGAAMLAFGNPSGQLRRMTDLAKYEMLTPRVVLVQKKDALTPDGKLDRNRRLGGWGAISGEIHKYLGGEWTARSSRTLVGTLKRLRAYGGEGEAD